MKENLKKLKQELKEIASQLKTNKPLYRKTVSAYDKSSKEQVDKRGNKYLTKDSEIGNQAYKLLSTVAKAKHEFRHKHIAYCLLRGRTMEQIESSGVRCGNQKKHSYSCNCPNMKYVEEIMNGVKNEVIYSSESRPIEESTSGTSGTRASGNAIVASSQQDTPTLGQRDLSVPEGERPSIFGAIKGFFR